LSNPNPIYFIYKFITSEYLSVVFLDEVSETGMFLKSPHGSALYEEKGVFSKEYH